MIDVGIIDSGVSSKLDIYQNLEVKSGSIVLCVTEPEDAHGTKCFKILNCYNKNVRIFSIKILNNLNGEVDNLKIALKWLYEHNVKLVNISLGNDNYESLIKFRSFINYYSNLGMILVCASSNSGLRTYPAALSNALNVCACQDKCMGAYYEQYSDLFLGSNFRANSQHALSISTITSRCNSYATPVVTSMIASILEQYPNINSQQVKCILYNSLNSNDVEKGSDMTLQPDWISSAVMFVFDANTKINNKMLFFTKLITVEVTSQNYVKKLKEYLLLGGFDTCIFYDNKNAISNFTDIVNLLIEAKKNLVLFHNKLLENIQEFLPIKIWSDMQFSHELVKLYKTDLKNANLNLDINIPCILATKKEIVVDLQKKFLQDGFSTFVISDNSIDVLYGFNYLPVETLSNSDISRWFLKNVASKIGCDVILIFVNEVYTCSFSYVDAIIKPYFNSYQLSLLDGSNLSMQADSMYANVKNIFNVI